jgi:hypothetical protein
MLGVGQWFGEGAAVCGGVFAGIWWCSFAATLCIFACSNVRFVVLQHTVCILVWRASVRQNVSTQWFCEGSVSGRGTLPMSWFTSTDLVGAGA